MINNYSNKSKYKKILPSKPGRPLSSIYNGDDSNCKVNITANRATQKNWIRRKYDHIDLDLLYEEQLRTLREINKSELNEINNKNNNKFNLIAQNKKKFESEKIRNSKNAPISILKPDSHSFNKGKFRESNLKKYTNLKMGNPKIRAISQYLKKNDLPKIVKKSNTKINFFGRNSSYNNLLYQKFGKIPEGINKKMFPKSKLKINMNKKREENKSCLMPEEERISTLKQLEESKCNIQNMIEKLPISLNSFGLRNRQEKLYKDLDEIEKAISTFSKNQVFINIDK